MTLVVGAVLVDSLSRPARLLAARRSDGSARWEFPGGKVEPGESPEEALVRELREELGIDARVHDLVGTWPTTATTDLQLHVVVTDDTPRAGDSHDELRWLGQDELDTVTWLPADEQALPTVVRRMSAQP